MDAIDIDTHAQRLFEEYGPRAMVVAAQRARAADESGDSRAAQTWRRIEKTLAEMRGAPES